MRSLHWVRHLSGYVIARWRWLLALFGLGGRRAGASAYLTEHAEMTFRALTDAVIPETDDLGAELGPDHEPGGLAIDLDTFAITFVDNLFQFGLPHVGPRGNLPIAIPVANALDIAALTLIARKRNESEPQPDRALDLLESGDGSAVDLAAAAGPFAMLSRRDRLRSIAILDALEVDVAPFRGLELELDGGVVGQLLVGFTELLYYSEWEGYEAFERPPSERVHANDSSAVQSWRQTGYPGTMNGHAALRGYLGTDESSLGAGDTWAVFEEEAGPHIRIYRESGSFRENDYDTAGYVEPYPEGG